MNNTIAQSVIDADGKDSVKLKFFKRLEEGKLTRDENPTSHLCVYFAAYDPEEHLVFIGLHKKSGFWLFNGGHMDPGENPSDAVIREAREEWGVELAQRDVPVAGLVTLTQIEHPERQICEWHFDLWYFLPRNAKQFGPDPYLLGKEFSAYGWIPFEEAKTLFSDPNSFEALQYVRSLPDGTHTV